LTGVRKRSHSIFAENFGEKSPDALTTNRTWSFAAAMTGDHKKGREILQSALSIVREQCDSPVQSHTDPTGMGGADDVANMWNEIAVLELSCGDAEASLKYLDESLRIYKGNHEDRVIQIGRYRSKLLYLFVVWWL
jgi:hypothetical protein